MGRPVTLFTGQWADLPLEQIAAKASAWGFDGLELACWGDHFEVDKALTDAGYVKSRWDILKKHNLTCMAISNHLVGQAICDPIDARHKAVLPTDVWGDGNPEGVRKRAASKMMDAARAAAKFGIDRVNGFTGSSIWSKLYSFPPNDFREIERGYRDFAERWGPIIDAFEKEGVKFALEVHPTEIAYDLVTTRKTLDAIEWREPFGLNFDPVAFIEEFGARIYHVHVKDSRRALDGHRSILGSHLEFGDGRRGWDFVSAGRGDSDFDAMFRALTRVGYQGPLSIEWEDAGMARDWGAPEALAFVRRTDFEPSAILPMAQMKRE
jgi:sugar phosphate isomerase/epimerase